MTVQAHTYGIVETLSIGGPIALLVLLIVLGRRRARELEAEDSDDRGNDGV
ncbi:MAG TPA: hypothetical protein VNB94_12350 [Mycobacteriales bacterium]|nr:hypothetical protein [Mycobacteriales bacterium]